MKNAVANSNFIIPRVFRKKSMKNKIVNMRNKKACFYNVISVSIKFYTARVDHIPIDDTLWILKKEPTEIEVADKLPDCKIVESI